MTLTSDTVYHDILLEKLKHYGIRGVAYSWVSNYLEKRLQYVKIDNSKSQLVQVTCGVTQGSVLGPLLFLLYINDICEVSKTLHFILFADDTNLFCSGDNLKQLWIQWKKRW